MKRAVFFDLYGTLIDIKTDEYDPAVYAVLSQYLSYHRVGIAPELLRRAYVGSVEQHMKASGETYPEVDVYRVFHDLMHKWGRKNYSRASVLDVVMLFRSLTRKHFTAFPSIYEALGQLSQKYRLAIISDAQWAFTEPEAAMLGLDRFFRLRVLSSRYGFKKPDTRLFEAAMKKIGVQPEDSLYIGDNPAKDLVGAKRAGMKFLFFRTACAEQDGFRPDGSFSDYQDLDGIIEAVL